MDLILQIFNAANNLTPLAIIGLLVMVLLVLVLGLNKIKTIKENDLHHVDLKLDAMIAVLHRIEVSLAKMAGRLD